MKKQKSLKQIFVVTGLLFVLILSLIIFLKSPLFEVDFVTTEVTLEAGTKPDSKADFYLDGPGWSVFLSHVDISNVKHTKVGRYPVYIQHGFTKYTSYVNIVDTTAPAISCDIARKTVEAGETLSVSSLGLNVTDYSEIESILFTNISSDYFYIDKSNAYYDEITAAYKTGIAFSSESFLFSDTGVYTLTICATDIFHNSSEQTITITVEAPPVIEAPSNFYVAEGSDIKFSEYADVWDFISQDLSSDSITIDASQVDLSKSGSYQISYSATDDYGLTATHVATVYVSTPTAIQERINTHSVNAATDVIIGAINPYDSGYYTTEDLAFIQQVMLPSIIHIENSTLCTFGSGFIIEITDDFVTIVSNEHVITDDMTVDITFFDGTMKEGSVVAYNPRIDIAFIRIPIDGKSEYASLTSEYVKNLRTVHINKGYWDKLANSKKLLIGYNCIDINGEIWQTTKGYMLEKDVLRDWNEYIDVNEMIISPPPIPGTSGSAIFDGYGHLIGMIRGYTHYDTHTETVAVPLKEILNYFESVFKYKIQYQ